MDKFFLLALLLLISACSEEERREGIIKPVSSIVISESELYENRTFTGKIEAANTTDLSFEVLGKVESVNIDLGAAFKKDDVLAQLEQTNFILNMKEAKARVSEAKARFSQAQNDFDRKQYLVESGAVSQSEFDVSQSQFKSAQDQVNIAEARLALAQEDLDDTTLLAPYDGTLAARFIEPSQRINANMAAFTIQGNGGLEVSTQIPEKILASISIGQRADVKIKALNEVVPATIQDIGTAAQNANSFPVTLKLETALSENLSRSLKVGMSSEITFKINKNMTEKQGFSVPVSAVMAGVENSHFIYQINDRTGTDAKATENPSYKLEKKPVNVLRFYDQNVVIEGNLKNGTRIARAGLSFLKDGQIVTLAGQDLVKYNP